MAISKVIYNNGNTSETWMDVTDDTVTSQTLLSTYQATGADGEKVQGAYTPASYSSQTKSVTPTESSQTVTPDTGYDGLSEVNVGAIASDYVGSGITRRTSSSLSASGATVTAPAGYYASSASKAVSSGSATAPASISGTSATVTTGTNTLTLTKSVSVTPSVTAGYVSSGTAGTSSVSLTASVNTRSSSDLTASGATVTAPAGYYASSASKSVASGTAGTPVATKGTVSSNSVSVTPSVTNTTGYITGSTKTGTAVTVSASELVSGNKSITSNGTGIDVTNYATVSVSVSTAPTLQDKSVTPTESQQVISCDTGYDGLDEVTVGAISSTYVGSGIARKSSTDLTASGATVSVPAGYYASNASKTVATGTEGTPTASKGAVSNHAISVTPSVTNGAGYISGGTKTGTAVSVAASELVSGTLNITENGTFDVTNYASVLAAITGLEFESGTYTPSTNTNRPTISFANTHTNRPMFIVMCDTTGGTLSSPENGPWVWASWYDFAGIYVKTSNSSSNYSALVGYYARDTDSSTASFTYKNITDSTSTTSNTAPGYWVTNSEFKPGNTSGTGYGRWNAGTTYVWIAVWAPTT